MSINLVNSLRVFAFVAITSFFYWEVFHRICIRAARFKLFALRDDLRRTAGEKGLGGTTEYKELEKLICVIIAYIPNISFLSFILSKTPPVSAEEREAFAKFYREAPQEFIDVRNAACKCAIIIMMLNSPWIIMVGSFAVLPLWALGKISGESMVQRTETFIDDLPPSPHLVLPSAQIA